ncbi:hypothetical protein BJF79_13650 [Actinomadura sp. CNU-125]|uniref:hypothetical protein n=1 Tax=Actinomadura sp. CNU-125 TaxID=1904961 RepID=UPI00096361DE|nr:hypothetical protein [Actinomadura sp. CNU-125]OLT24382.1 hypothetical protein BJF79_13650 [Actinomadura sp. CNU-125]
MILDLDEPLFSDDHAFHGLLTLDEITEIETDWKAAKVDEWCAVTALTAAANHLRTVAALPAAARFGYVLNAAFNTAVERDPRAARAVQAYRDAHAAYRNATHAKTCIRRRAHAA